MHYYKHTLVEEKASWTAALNPLIDTPHSNWTAEISLIRPNEMAVVGRLGEAGHNRNRIRVASSDSQAQNVHRTTCTLAATKIFYKIINVSQSQKITTSVL